jgi:hypothetical protein
MLSLLFDSGTILRAEMFQSKEIAVLNQISWLGNHYWSSGETAVYFSRQDE